MPRRPRAYRIAIDTLFTRRPPLADGMTPHAVARHGLLKPRKPDTVYGWLDGTRTRAAQCDLVPTRRRASEVVFDRTEELQERLRQAPSEDAQPGRGAHA